MIRIAHTVPRKLTLGLLLTVLALPFAGCGGSSGGGMTPSDPDALFEDSGTAATPNVVRMTGGTVDGSEVTVHVTVSGTAGSPEIYGFAFDLLLEDPDIVGYVSSSVAPGSFLDATGCTGLDFQAHQDDDRVIVAATKTGDCDGNAATGLDEIVVSLIFKALDVGESDVSFAATPSGQQPAALDSDSAPILAVTFDATAATIHGQ
ncbi:MAG: hypothetical protein GY716_12615 [bacterium]|nr:hypothetical protein [bacterium]